MLPRDAGFWETLNHHLVVLDRERSGCEASSTAAVIDSQSVKTTESGGPRGYDAGRKAMGRKRHATAIRVEIIRKTAEQVGLAAHPRHWVVERFFA